MPVYTYEGRKWNIPEDKVESFLSDIPGAQLAEQSEPAPTQNQQAQNIGKKNYLLDRGPGAVTDTFKDLYEDKAITPRNKAQKQDGFWASGFGDSLEKLGSGAVRLMAGLGQTAKMPESAIPEGEKLKTPTAPDSPTALGGLFGAAESLSEKGDRYGLMYDEGTGELRKKKYSDLWKEGKKGAALGEILLTATESAPTSALALTPYVGLPLIAMSAAGSKYNELEQNPDMEEWQKVLNASVSGAIEGLTEKLGARVDVKVFEPILKNITETTVKKTLAKGGVNALIQTLTEGGEEVISQLGGNITDYATGATDKLKLGEGVGDAFVYGAGGGAQFGGITMTGTAGRAAQMAYAKRDAKNRINRFDQKNYQYFDDWGTMKERLLSSPIGDRKQMAIDVFSNDDIPVQGKAAFIDYVNALNQQDAINQKQENDNQLAVQNGREMIVNPKLRKLLSTVNQEKMELESRLGDIATVPEDQIEAFIESGMITPEQLEDLNTYNQRRAEYDGIVQQLREEVDAQMAPVQEDIQRVSRRDGNVIYADFSGEGRLPIINGNVSQNPDGSIDAQNTDKSLTVLMPDGRRRMISSKFITGNVQINTPDELIDEARQQAYQAIVTPVEEEITGTKKFKEGDPVEYVDEKGQTQAGSVASLQGNTVTVVPNDGNKSKIRTFTQEQLRASIVAETLGNVRVRDILPVNIPQGFKNIKPGNYQVHVEDIQDGSAVLRFTTPGETDQYITDATLDDINSLIAKQPQLETEDQEAEQEEVPAETPSFPVDKEGNIDFDKITDDNQYVSALQQEFGEDAIWIAEEYKKNADTELNNISRIKDPIKRKREEIKRQKEVSRWDNILQSLKPSPTYQDRIESISIGNIKERESNMGEYLSLKDYLLRTIGTGVYKFAWNDIDGTRGLKNEVFASRNTEAERKRRIYFLNNNGYTPETLAHEIWENAGQGTDINEDWARDTNDIRNEIIDIMLSYDTPTSMIDEAANLRQAPENAQEYEESIDPALIFEYEANEASQDEMLRSLPTLELHNTISDAEVDAYFSQQTSEEEFNNYINSITFEQNNIQHGTDPNTGTGIGDNQSNVGQDPGTKATADDAGRNRRSTNSNQDEGSDNLTSTGEVAVTGERSTPAGIEQPTAEGTRQEPGRPAERQTEGVVEQPIEPSTTRDKLEIEAEAAKVDVNPTEAQKEAGNYKKGHVNIAGFEITIENQKGSERSGTDPSGRKWTRTLKSHYGYFKRTKGKDGDQIDVFIGENPESRFIFVVDQLNQDETFDEHKVMLGYDSFDRAKEAYLENYEEGWQGLGAMTVVEMEDFRKWLDSDSKRIKPFAEYKQIQETIHETEKGAKSSPKQTTSVENNQQEFSSDGVEQPVNQPNDKQVDRPLSDQKENIEPEIVDKKKEQPTANIDKIIRSVSGLTPANQQTWGKSFIGISQAIKIEKDIREFQDAAITGGTIEYNSNLDRHYYEMIDGEEKKINIYKLNGYTVRLGNEYGFNVRDGGYYTEIENPQGEVVKIYEKVYKTDKTVRISYQHPRSIEQNNGQPEIVQKAKEAVENDRKNKPQAQGKSTSTPVERIEDFGEKIGGARKDLAQEYKTKLSEIKEDDIRSKPLSKIFPRLDLKKLVENGDLTQDDALYLNYRYDNIPTKPRDTGGFYQKMKLDKWINDVQKEIKLAYTILSQEKSFGHLDLLKKIKLEENAGYRYYQNGDEIEVTPEQRLMLNDDWMHIKTLKALGFPTSGIKMGNARLQYRVHSGEQYIVKVNNKRSLHKTFEDAVDYLKNELEKPTKRETVFNIYQNRKSGKYFIGKPIQGKEPIQLSEWFDTQKEVTDYFRDNRDEVQAKWDAMSVKPEERRSENRERQGRDWRNGKDVTPEQFQSEFGFRGTEFGNWVNQQERQDALNNAYDALMDLSSVLDISPRALSLNGELGMAFGARGTGNAGGSTAAAHYESAKVVINLTKKSGAGSLAHEWWHALDNYFARMGKKSLDYATDGTKGLDANVREEMKQAFTDIVDAIKKSELPKRSGELDKTRSKPYWATNVEMSARAFENYVIEALSKKGDSNDYLANFKELSDWATVGSFEVDSYPYPTKEESHDINEKFQQFFDTIQEKLDEETGNTLLFRKVDESGFYSTVEDALREIAPNGMPLFRKKDSEAREAYAMREWNRAKNAINKLSEKMGLDVEIMETTEGLPKGKAESKGWYDVNSKKITIVMPNHTSSWDAQATLLHEAVGHHGLRELFGEHFNTFLDNVYNNAEEGIKDQIDRIGGDTRKATDEYLSRLAEDQEILQTDRLRGFFNEVRKFFFEMLAKLGFNPGFKLSENELKYILWRSYQNLAEPGRFMSVAAQAEDIAMQHKLKVGDYAEKEVSANVAEEPGSGLPTAITVDGVERSTTNSDGRPIASSEEGIRNFWRWFGDSKVVDAEGRPIVVYHATQSDFNEFKTRKIGTSVDFGTLGSGFYFTTSAENANNYASNLNTNTGKQSGESIMPVYLKINNPYDAQRLREVSGDSKKESENFTNKNKKKGHDGAKFEWRSDFVWYVAFNPNQIKSAIGNTGTFDPGNDDIRYRSDESIQDDLSRSAQERSESYQKAINTFNTSDNIDNRVESAKEIINYYETLFGNSATSYIFRNGKEMLEALDNEGGFVSQALRERILAGSVQGIFSNGRIYIDASTNLNNKELEEVWLHEQNHKANKRMSESDLTIIYYTIGREKLREIFSENITKLRMAPQANEYIAYHAGWLTRTHSIEDISKGNINFGNYPEFLQEIIKNNLNSLKDGTKTDGNNMGRRDGSGDIYNAEREGSMGDVDERQSGERSEQTSLSDTGQSQEEVALSLEKANTLFNNADNLKSVIPKYSGFLNDVLQGSPAKSDIIANAREKGFTSMPKAIEEYLANVEDPAELSRIKELLGVEMPDNALRYMLWRNANPDDGTVVWKAKDAVKTNELDENILFRKGEVPKPTAKQEYESRVRSRHNRGFKSLMTGMEEGWFDRMNSLDILQKAIAGDKAIPERMNAYLLENQLSSKNTSQIRTFNQRYIDPMIQAAEKVFGRDIAALDNYLNAKHGLERNDYMAREESKRIFAKKRQAAINDLNAGKIEADEWEAIKDELDQLEEDKYMELLEKRDYSGLTAIAEERGNGETFTEAAQNIVKEVEGKTPAEDIAALWKAINEANAWMLKKQYDSGMMTKEVYDKVSSMYHYYVPLRGFAETTAEEVYEYLENETSDFNKVLRKAYGRKSKAESPFANMISMGESGIMQANKNSMKQAFYRLVATNPNNLATINDVWYVKAGDEYIEKFPDIPADADGDQVADIISKFNDNMEELRSAGEAFRGKHELALGMKIGKGQASEHAVRVWVGGEEKVIYINGNPRAAQAINGLTNSSLQDKSTYRRQIEFWGRQMSANFTSRNPAFMATNFMRDVQFALVSAAIKEGGTYSLKLGQNFMQVPKTIAMNVFGKGGGKFNNYWQEFTLNGGETGYANLSSIDHHRKYVNKKLREFSDQRDFIAPFRAYVAFMENSNRIIEDISRFSTYVTSRQMGRSIERSISDAKEITLNFNRKGSGRFGASLVHSFYLFANPALQGLRLMGMLAKNHPVRFTAATASMMAMGYFAPILNEIMLNLFGDDDDKEKYWNLSDWTRRNNLVIYAPWTEDNFMTFTLPHELRPFYGIGEIINSTAQGKMITKNPMAEIVNQFSTILPIDPFGGRNWWVPSAALPVWESYVSNENFMGIPVYKDTPWNKLDPEWAKAYNSTPKVLVEGARWLNDVSGGDDVTKGRIDLNPARLAHVFRGYMGGFLTTYTDVANASFNLLTGNDVSINDFPVGNKLIRTSDDRTELSRINEQYYFYLEWMQDYEHRKRGYKGKMIDDGDYIKKYSDLIRSGETAAYNKAKAQVEQINDLRERDPEMAEERKKAFVEEMRSINDD